MEPVSVAARIKPDGSITLLNLPFRPGEEVRVVVTELQGELTNDWRSLRGLISKYDTPFEPATSPDDWEALQ